ncbi:hypothetical protein ACFFF7_15795 [Novosphingobium aquiterrae]|uniref:Uncharacterized protein n=1 Tax=Novosphingobium aquiterrae TaxID=624388 RepID=A0ABV6PM06_9SPHN
MAVSLIYNGLGLVLAAAATPVAAGQANVSVAAPRVERAATPAAATPRLRTRDERIGAVALRGFPAGEQWFPPARSWGEAGGPVVEIGALGSRRDNQPDLAHLSVNWQF